jgi:hypothetical protein
MNPAAHIHLAAPPFKDETVILVSTTIQMATPPLQKCTNLMRTAETGVGLHVDLSLGEGEAAGGAEEEP